MWSPMTGLPCSGKKLQIMDTATGNERQPVQGSVPGLAATVMLTNVGTDSQADWWRETGAPGVTQVWHRPRTRKAITATFKVDPFRYSSSYGDIGRPLWELAGCIRMGRRRWCICSSRSDLLHVFNERGRKFISGLEITGVIGNPLTPTVAIWVQQLWSILCQTVLSRRLQFLTSGHSDAQPRSPECPVVKNYKRRLNTAWHRMLFSCTRIKDCKNNKRD